MENTENTENTETIESNAPPETNSEQKKEKDVQSEKWFITINNPEKYGFTHEKIKEILIKDFKTFVYCAMADEMGKTYHVHIFAYFNSRVRFSTLKKAFYTANIQKAKGLVSQCVDYVAKRGKWEDSEKSETRIPNTFEELGRKPPDSKGKNPQMTALYQYIQDGLSNSEIITINQDYIKMLDKIDMIRTTLLIDRYKNTIRKDLRVIYIYGATGTGKTFGVLERHQPSNVHRVVDYSHPFDSYTCQSVVCFEEFRSQLRMSDMLNYLDIYPLELSARYFNKFACYKTVYLVSNWELEKQYHDLQESDNASWKAFLRRINEVWHYTDIGKVTKYHSVQEYINRDEGFYEPSPEELKDCPFNI